MNTPNPPWPDIPAQIRAELGRRGWSVRTLSEQTREVDPQQKGISHTTLYRRLSDHNSLNIRELALIADALGLTVSTIIARAEDVAA